MVPSDSCEQRAQVGCESSALLRGMVRGRGFRGTARPPAAQAAPAADADSPGRTDPTLAAHEYRFVGGGMLLSINAGLGFESGFHSVP